MARGDGAATPERPPPTASARDLSYAQEMSGPPPDGLVSATLFHPSSLSRTPPGSRIATTQHNNSSSSSSARRYPRPDRFDSQQTDRSVAFASPDISQPYSPRYGDSRAIYRSQSARALIPGLPSSYLTSGVMMETVDRPRSMAGFASTEKWDGERTDGCWDSSSDRSDGSPRQRALREPHGRSSPRERSSRHAMARRNDLNTSLSTASRSPAYPPPNLRRTQTARVAVVDTDLGDEDDVSLFAQATAGLGPDMMFGSSSGGRPEAVRARTTTPIVPSQWPRPYASPPFQADNPAPLNHPSRVPSTGQFPSQYTYSQQSPSQHQRVSSVPLTVTTLRPPTPPYVPPATLDELDPWGNACPPPDDELPDYASSQAQAQASQRVEAARRAQELQRRWQQSAYRPRYA